MYISILFLLILEVKKKVSSVCYYLFKKILILCYICVSDWIFSQIYPIKMYLFAHLSSYISICQAVFELYTQQLIFTGNILLLYSSRSF